MSDDRPGRYAKHVPLAQDRSDELTQRTLARLAEDREIDAIIARMEKRNRSTGSTPPGGRVPFVTHVLLPVVVAAVLAAGGAALAMWRSEAVAEERQHTLDRRIDIVDRDLRSHGEDGGHPRTLEAISKLGAQLDGISVRLDRIERQLDAQRQSGGRRP